MRAGRFLLVLIRRSKLFLIQNWWIFTIQPVTPPPDPDPAQYLAANPDLQPHFGNDHAAALNHWRQYGWAEGRPTAP